VRAGGTEATLPEQPIMRALGASSSHHARAAEQDAGSAEQDAGSAEPDAGSAPPDAGSAPPDAVSAEPHVDHACAAHAGDEGVPATSEGLTSLPSVHVTRTGWPGALPPQHLVRTADEGASPPSRPPSSPPAGPRVKPPVKRKRPDGRTYTRFMRTALRKPDPGSAAAAAKLDRLRLAATLFEGRSVPPKLERI
jgi:hypothetical protein